MWTKVQRVEALVWFAKEERGTVTRERGRSGQNAMN